MILGLMLQGKSPSALETAFGEVYALLGPWWFLVAFVVLSVVLLYAKPFLEATAKRHATQAESAKKPEPLAAQQARVEDNSGVVAPMQIIDSPGTHVQLTRSPQKRESSPEPSVPFLKFA